MKLERIKELRTLGQSVWLDFIQRGMLERDELKPMISEGLGGMTSNPTIFEKAISSTADYDTEIRALAKSGLNREDIYTRVTVADIKEAARQIRPVFDQTNGKDGFVSLEVSPHLGKNTEGTIKEARALWAALDSPNVMIKVPGTLAGLPAVRQLISEGINLNITLLFSVPRYAKVVDEYIAGLEMRRASGKPVNAVASVASFFLSRIDSLIDPQLEKLIAAGGPKAAIAKGVLGSVAVNSAKAAYQVFKQAFHGARFKALAEAGAQPQRLLWASTSSKNPKYSDVKYIEELIGPETVNTLPLETILAFKDHGQVANTLETNVEASSAQLKSLPELGIDLTASTDHLEQDGLDKFTASYDKLLDAIESKRAASK